MTLSFSTQINGVSNYFVEKILSGIDPLSLRHELPDVVDYNVFTKCQPKIHTIREDKKDRWKAGNNVHFVINNRTKNRFQFAPVLKVKSVEKIRFQWFNRSANDENNPFLWTVKNRSVRIFINERKLLDANEIVQLAQNDGFALVSAFFNYFGSDFTGKIIHWTDYSYCG